MAEKPLLPQMCVRPLKWLDLHMLAVARGRERSAAEYAELLGAAGLTLTRILPTESGTSVIEARRA